MTGEKHDNEPTVLVGASVSLPYTIRETVGVRATQTIVEELLARDAGTGTDRAEVERVVSDYGWDVTFTDDPDGGVTSYLKDAETHAVLKSYRGTDFHDACLGLFAETYPPSQEGR